MARQTSRIKARKGTVRSAGFSFLCVHPPFLTPPFSALDPDSIAPHTLTPTLDSLASHSEGVASTNPTLVVYTPSSIVVCVLISNCFRDRCDIFLSSRHTLPWSPPPFYLYRSIRSLILSLCLSLVVYVTSHLFPGPLEDDAVGSFGI